MDADPLSDTATQSDANAQSGLRRSLEAARKELLDLTTRSRLLHTPRGRRVKIIQIEGESAHEVFRVLVSEGKAISFLPAVDPESDDDEEAEGDWLEDVKLDDGTGENSLEVRHSANKLQTSLEKPKLQRRLLQLYYDARSFQEEQGTNILYLALGFLRWFEAESSSTARLAPLILVPVSLERRSARSRFRACFNGEELETNLSLQSKLKLDFGIELPDLPDVEELSLDEYFDSVEKAVAGHERWNVLREDIVLGEFSFAKFLMYRDLDPRNWPSDKNLEEHNLVSGLLGDGFREEQPLITEEANLDEIVDPADMVHVMDADSSQMAAIEEVRYGQNLIIQGPPGTGKSQTIANLIATAVREGKRVLFLAEKMAALDVVKRRLDDIGLGDMCLELHSHKARKKTVLQELQRALNLGRPKTSRIDETVGELIAQRDHLNAYARALHTTLDASGFTPYEIIGNLVQLKNAGAPVPDYRLPKAIGWTREAFKSRKALLAKLGKHVEKIGLPEEHVWRGVGLKAVLPQDVVRIRDQADVALRAVSAWRNSLASLAERLRVTATSFEEAEALTRMAKHLTAAPAMDRSSLTHPAWRTRRQSISELLESGKRFTEARERLANTFVPEAWDADLREVRRTLNTYGRSWWRIFRADYRRARTTLKSYLTGAPPKQMDEQLAILDELRNGQESRAAIRDKDALGRAAFGTLWNLENSSWKDLEAIADWQARTAEEDLPWDIFAVGAEIEGETGLESRVRELEQATVSAWQAFRNLAEALQLDARASFNVDTLNRVSVDALVERLRCWSEDPPDIQEWITYSLWCAEARDLDLAPIIDRLHDGRLPGAKAASSFASAFFEELMREAQRVHPSLATFNGSNHAQIVERFRRLDKQRIGLAREEVARVHYDGIPVGHGHVGELGVLKREMQKKRRHLPLRRLMREAGTAIQAIKPVFMMSPMSVAQFLEPGQVEFDLLLVDEASQVQPVEALGAVARCEQLAVVGDQKQLPPTRFFQRFSDEHGGEDEEEFAAGDIESILGLCAAQGLNEKMLRWHYRSRHESLIAVSNQEFYDSRLCIVPSVQKQDDLGLHFRYVEDGVYDRGGAANNVREARRVAQAVIDHARERPELTLGVGTFSVRQRDAILDQLEQLRLQNPDTEPFLADGGMEAFFVKNLESVQGDERDVMFISVGYGPDKSGYMAMDFGPLANEGGERRLNVLITRARQRCVVFSSIRARDIDLARARSVGARVLKKFLQYADTGNLEVGIASRRSADSPFEEEVARALRSQGFEVEHQVGVAGFFIDLAVRDPEAQGRYLLGIECDGATYHSSRSARDRDRLRQQVLEDRGWRLHRIWSTDWFYRSEEEQRKLLAAVEAARAHNGPSVADVPSRPTVPGPTSQVVRQQYSGGSEADIAASPSYEEADFRVDVSVEPHEARLNLIVDTVEKIVAIEEPVHEIEVGKRLATVWGKERAGRRIHGAALRALRSAVQWGRLHKDGRFYSTRELSTVVPRNRANVLSTTLRKPEMLPPVELRTALSMTVERHIGVSEDDVLVEAARLLGFQRTGGALREVIARELQNMLSFGSLVLRDGKLYSSEQN